MENFFYIGIFFDFAEQTIIRYVEKHRETALQHTKCYFLWKYKKRNRREMQNFYMPLARPICHVQYHAETIHFPTVPLFTL